MIKKIWRHITYYIKGLEYEYGPWIVVGSYTASMWLAGYMSHGDHWYIGVSYTAAILLIVWPKLEVSREQTEDTQIE